MKSAEDIRDLVKNATIDSNPEVNSAVLQGLLEELDKCDSTDSAAVKPDLRRKIMKSRIMRCAAAAAVIVAAAVLIHYVGSPIESVALADALERVEKARAFMYRMKMTTTGNMMPNMPTRKQETQGTITIIISDEYGMKMEMDMIDPNSGEKMTGQTYVLPDQKIAVSVVPQMKKYMRMEFDDDLLARMKKQNNDPREMIKQIISCKYTELGRSVIDGIEVEGFETTDPSWDGGAMGNVKVRLWVDVESWLPVRAEMDFRINEQMQMQGVIYDYQWDIVVDAGQFEPVIPEDFTSFAADGMKMPSMSEEAAVEGLRYFAEISAQYPKKLDMMSLLHEFLELRDQGLRNQAEMNQMPKVNLQKAMDMWRSVQSLAMFYLTLAQDGKEPVYYGESVGPDDADALLMRWKISEDEYRVIFGDLATENVSAEQLAELETPLRE